MKNSLHIRFYILEARSRKNEHPIYCRITINRLKAEFNTGYYCSAAKWNEKKERVHGNTELNAVLTQIEDRLNGLYFEKTFGGNKITAKDLKDIYNGKDKSSMKLVDYFDVYVKEIASLPDTYTYATLKKYKTIQRHLLDFLGTTGKKDMQITGFKIQNVYEFEYHLKSVARLNTNTVAKYLKQMKAVMNRAIHFGYLATNPFDNYKFKIAKTNRTFLTKDELLRIEKLEIDNHSIQKVKDCFLFCVYTGLRYSDMFAITPKNLTMEPDGRYWLEFKVRKTKENLRIPVLNKPLEIIRKYELESQITGKLLPAISNQKINSYLKVIQDLADINKVLTFHVSRHTFATTITLSNNIPIEVVSKLMGHSNLETTQVYAKITNDYLAEQTLTLNEKI